MRINEEIDALESMASSISTWCPQFGWSPAWRPSPHRSDRGDPVVLASEFVTVALFGQSAGLYRHFHDVPQPLDLMWSFLQAVLMAHHPADHTISAISPKGSIRRGRGRRQRGADLADRRGR